MLDPGVFQVRGGCFHSAIQNAEALCGCRFATPHKSNHRRGTELKTERHRYRLLIEPVSDCREPEAIRGLRWLLKRMLRQYGLKCVEITTERMEDETNGR